MGSDGCSAMCATETGFTCTGMPSACVTICGDGLRAGAEACDDSNTTAGDGCSATCTVETGYTCAVGNLSICGPICGDGTRVGAETCDDGNGVGNDGCSATCRVETGYACTGTPSACATTCGDGLRAGAEACDDGNITSLDGCSGTCTTETGYTCTGSPSVCTGTCGDGLRAGGEACDDANTTANDGCSATCTVETGYTCTGAPSACTAVCGDGVRRGSEACDDGNTTVGDGCSAVCVVEAGHLFETEPNDDGTISTGARGADFSSTSTNGPITSVTLVHGAFGVAGDEDGYAVTNSGSGPLLLSVDVYDAAAGLGAACTILDTYLWVRNAAGAILFSNDDRVSGSDTCSGLTFSLPAGATAYLHVGTYDDNDVVPGYLMRVNMAHCGDGTVESPIEGCDDGNATAGDGCSASCTVEAGYACAGAPSACAPLCGNGLINAGEACDDANVAAGDGCSPTCAVEAGWTCNSSPSPSVCVAAICGNGVLESGERCDDGNTANGDGCASTCQWELVLETEPNQTCATANGPTVLGSLGVGPMFGGAFTAGDTDSYSFTIAAYADVAFETFDQGAPGTCSNDTFLTLLAPDCTTQLLTDDDDGVGACSLMTPTTDPAVRHLAPGTYTVQARAFSATAAFTYSFRATVISLCGNGTREGSEACDGSPICDATCQLIPVCGDGVLSGVEQCDDGNTVAGDGCGATCLVEALAEVEPNDTTVQADTALAPIAASTVLVGAIGTTADVDFFKVVVAAPTVVRFETFTAANFCDATTTMTLRLMDSAGTQLITEGTTNASGIASCAAIVFPLAAGTYYVKVEETGVNAVIARYYLDVQFATDRGTETEPNETTATASTNFSSVTNGSVVSGDHMTVGDADYYAITVPAGKGVRIEVVEGDRSVETCEALGMDSLLGLYSSTGTLLVSDDDDGRGYCSAIDGTGNTPRDAAAKNTGVTAATWFIAVRNSSATTGAAAQFTYKLHVTIR